MSETKKTLMLYGMPWYITLVCCAVVLFAVAVGGMGTDIPSTLAVCLAIGIPLYEIGNRVPIWNSYIGGGILLAFLGTAALNYFHIIPEKYAESINAFTDDMNFLTVFIVILIAGSVLSLDRKTLIKSFFGYIPAIIGGVAAAMLFGIIGGWIFGVPASRIVTHYVLPIMGGGNGGGAIPLSEMFQQVTGKDKSVYYGFAVIILTVANIFAILGSALLNKLGNIKKEWTGDKTTILRKTEVDASKTESSVPKDYVPSIKEIGAGLLLAFSCYAFGRLMAYFVPKIAGFPIHNLAYMIIFVVIITALGVIPEKVRLGAKRLQSFFSTSLTLVIMVGVGVDMDLGELIAALSPANVVISIFIVLGAIVGSAVVGWLVGFYPIDTAITAGLCMANRGGSGDLAVLGAGERMGLMAYAQLSSRLGGALILLLGSILFSILLK